MQRPILALKCPNCGVPMSCRADSEVEAADVLARRLTEHLEERHPDEPSNHYVDIEVQQRETDVRH